METEPRLPYNLPPAKFPIFLQSSGVSELGSCAPRGPELAVGSCRWEISSHEGEQEWEMKEKSPDHNPHLPARRLKVEAGRVGAGEEVGGKSVDLERKRCMSIHRSTSIDRVPAVCQALPEAPRVWLWLWSLMKLTVCASRETDVRQIKKCRA